MLKKTLLALAALLAVALLMEGAIRLYVLIRYSGNWDTYNVWNIVYESHPHSYFRLKTDSRFSIFGGKRLVETDSHGFRSPEPKPVKPRNGYRIAFLGGSTTFNTTAPSNDDTIPLRVGVALKEIYPQREIEVLNAATAGYTTMESLTSFVSRVLPLEPDLVIVYHGVNDAVFRTMGEYRPDYWRPPKPASTRFDTLLYRRSLLYRLFIYKSIVGRESARPPADRLEANRVMNRPTAFEHNLRSIVGVAEIHRIDVILCTFAYCPDPGLEDRAEWEVLFRGIDEQNTVVEKVVRETGVRLLDIARRMPCDRELFSDQIHRNRDGVLVHARLLTDYLVEEGLVEAE